MTTETPQRIITFIDIETAGKNRRRHPIIEVAAMAVEAGTWNEVSTFEAKVEFNVDDADPIALGINKFKPSTWEKYALPPKVVAEKFSAFCRKHATVEKTSKRGKSYKVTPLAGHNAETFDGHFLRAWYRKQLIFFPVSMRVLCTKQRAMWFFEENQGLTPPANFKLMTLCKYFGILAPDHSALNDVRATVQLARVLAELQQSRAMANAA